MGAAHSGYLTCSITSCFSKRSSSHSTRSLRLMGNISVLVETWLCRNRDVNFHFGALEFTKFFSEQIGIQVESVSNQCIVFLTHFAQHNCAFTIHIGLIDVSSRETMFQTFTIYL